MSLAVGAEISFAKARARAAGPGIMGCAGSNGLVELQEEHRPTRCPEPDRGALGKGRNTLRVEALPSLSPTAQGGNCQM
jgi:hypothetical protein